MFLKRFETKIIISENIFTKIDWNEYVKHNSMLHPRIIKFAFIKITKRVHLGLSHIKKCYSIGNNKRHLEHASHCECDFVNYTDLQSDAWSMHWVIGSQHAARLPSLIITYYQWSLLESGKRRIDIDQFSLETNSV